MFMGHFVSFNNFFFNQQMNRASVFSGFLLLATLKAKVRGWWPMYQPARTQGANSKQKLNGCAKSN